MSAETIDLTKASSCDDSVVPESLSTPESTPASVPVEDRTESNSRFQRKTVLVLAALGLAAAIAVCTWGYAFLVLRPDDRALAPSEQKVAVDAAAQATVSILSYKSDTVDSDLATANSLLTGQFADYYKSFTRDVVAPAAKEKRITTSASVVGQAISEFSENSASVLLFVNQSTTVAEAPRPSTTSTAIRVVLDREGGKWLVSKFEPV
ncbi:twin-arginine translocation pathway signal [Nocardia gamkensis]|uniref:twin-arginine translocation pathway signal n=1 Tax=Nocardia gamkensis TaxID=352869 RepID=UPI0037C7652E